MAEIAPQHVQIRTSGRRRLTPGYNSRVTSRRYRFARNAADVQPARSGGEPRGTSIRRLPTVKPCIKSSYTGTQLVYGVQSLARFSAAYFSHLQRREIRSEVCDIVP